MAILRLGQRVSPYGKVAAVGTTGGERYYWFVDKWHCVSMIPANCVEPQPEKVPA